MRSCAYPSMAFVLVLMGILGSGCDAPKVVSVSRQKQASAPMGQDAYCTVDAYSGHDLLIVRFDTCHRGDGMPPFPTLTTADGKDCNRRGETWNEAMGSTVEVWFDVPEGQTQFTLHCRGKEFPIHASKGR